MWRAQFGGGLGIHERFVQLVRGLQLFRLLHLEERVPCGRVEEDEHESTPPATSLRTVVIWQTELEDAQLRAVKSGVWGRRMSQGVPRRPVAKGRRIL